MGWLLAVFLVSSPAAAPDTLPSRVLLPASSIAELVQGVEPMSFDLIDLREEERIEALKSKPDAEPHTFFVVKRHIGASAGYDNTILHGSVGLYLTVAEWGRWNFGVPSIGVGAGRYPLIDRANNRLEMKGEPTVFVSIASVHYRLGYVRSLAATWYFSLEQVYDLRYNVAGSQFGVSFSSK